VRLGSVSDLLRLDAAKNDLSQTLERRLDLLQTPLNLLPSPRELLVRRADDAPKIAEVPDFVAGVLVVAKVCARPSLQ
jgi:hypothetical protein